MTAPPRADFAETARTTTSLPERSTFRSAQVAAPEVDVRRELSRNDGGAQPDGHVVRGEGRVTDGPPAPFHERSLGMAVGGRRSPTGWRTPTSTAGSVARPRCRLVRAPPTSREKRASPAEVCELQLAAGHGDRDRGDPRVLHAEARDPKTGDARVDGREVPLDAELGADRRLEGQPVRLNRAIRRLGRHTRPVREPSVVQDHVGVERPLPSPEADPAPRREQAQRVGDDRAAFQVPVVGDVVEDIEAVHLLQVERIHRGPERAANAGGERDAAVGEVHPVRRPRSPVRRRARAAGGRATARARACRLPRAGCGSRPRARAPRRRPRGRPPTGGRSHPSAAAARAPRPARADPRSLRWAAAPRRHPGSHPRGRAAAAPGSRTRSSAGGSHGRCGEAGRRAR